MPGTMLTVMATVPALPVILLPPSICLARQVPYARMPAQHVGHLGPTPDQSDSGHGFPRSGRRAAAAHMARAWPFDEKQQEEEGWYKGVLVPL